MRREFTTDDVKAFLHCVDLDLVRAITRTNDARALRLFACNCASAVVAMTGWDDERSISSLETARRFASGEASPNELENAFRNAKIAADEWTSRPCMGDNSTFMPPGYRGDLFQLACAARTCWYCASESAVEAATVAAYETFHAFNHRTEELRSFARKLLNFDGEVDTSNDI